MSKLIKLDFPEKDWNEISALGVSHDGDTELEWDESKGSIVAISMSRRAWTQVAKAAIGASHLIELGFYHPNSEVEIEDDIVWSNQLKRIAVRILMDVHGFDLVAEEQKHIF